MQITSFSGVKAEMSETLPTQSPSRHTISYDMSCALSALYNKPNFVGRKHQVLKIRKRVQKAAASNGLFSSNSGRFLAAI